MRIPTISRRKFLGTTAGAGIAVAAGRSLPTAPAGVVVLAAQAPQAAPPAGGPAPDLMLVNGRIHTMDARNTVASTVTVRNGRIAAVGNAAQRGPAPPGTQVIDLRGRTVVPGLRSSTSTRPSTRNSTSPAGAGASVPDVEIKKIRSVLTIVDGKIVARSS